MVLLAVLFDGFEQIAFEFGLFLEFLGERLGFDFLLDNNGYGSFFGLDVEFVASELAGKANILAAFADSNAQLVFGHSHQRLFVGFVNGDFGDFGGTQSVSNVGDGVFAPNDDVDFFLLANLAHHGVYARAMATDKSADWVDTLDRAVHGEFGANAGFAGDVPDFDSAAFHFRHFAAEEPLNEFAAAARHDQLRAAKTALNIF